MRAGSSPRPSVFSLFSYRYELGVGIPCASRESPIFLVPGAGVFRDVGAGGRHCAWRTFFQDPVRDRNLACRSRCSGCAGDGGCPGGGDGNSKEKSGRKVLRLSAFLRPDQHQHRTAQFSSTDIHYIHSLALENCLLCWVCFSFLLSLACLLA